MVHSLYIHVPFCTQKCNYCSFYSVPRDGVETGYFSLLERELRAGAREAGCLETLYIGGGTPSCMPVDFVPRVLQAVRNSYAVAEDAEMTCEANPETLTPEKARAWSAAGVNRISLGVQSFDEAILTFLGRRHTAQQAERAVDAARQAGIDNVSIDLIYAIPTQTMTVWERTLRRAAMLALPHVSCYALSIDDGTPFAAMRELSLIHI